MEDNYAALRSQMVEEQIKAREVKDLRILSAFLKVPRHQFVPEVIQDQAYDDNPLAIGYKQTISQPYIVAFMTEAAQIRPTDKVLEIGTGSGYQAAILAELCAKVYTVEIVEPLAMQAQRIFKELGYHNIHSKVGDGYEGWPDKALFDAIIVTAAPDFIPEKLLQQLKIGGRMVIPVGEKLIRVTRTKEGFDKEYLLPVRFVPMTGKAQEHSNQY